MAGRVLCADVDPHVCGIVRESLLGQGYEVETQHDGQAALESLSHDPFDFFR